MISAPDALLELTGLRRRREARAQEEVMHGVLALDEAAGALAQARRDVSDHLRQVAETVDEAVRAMLGKPATAAGLCQIQRLHEMANRRTSQLVQRVQAAGLLEAQRRRELADARRQYSASRQAVTKLERVADELKRRSSLRQTSLQELSDEEDRGQISQDRGPLPPIAANL